MAGSTNSSFITVNPNYIMPDVILQYQQLSGAFDILPDGNPMVRLGEGDLYVYVKKFDVRTKQASGQTGYNMLPGASIVPSYISTPTYLVRTRAEYDHHDIAAASVWGYSLPEAQRLAMRQGIFQQLRNALLYGFTPANGEGILNTANATRLNLPPDSNGNTTISTYDNGQLAIFWLTQIAAAKTRMLQIGMPQKIVITSPQRVLAAMQYQGVVQLTQFQREGAGVNSITGMVESVAGWSGDSVEWNVDDTLIGKGSGGTDAIILNIPEVKKPTTTGINTNEFAKLAPGLEATSLMLCDMVAPREIVAPLPGGATDVLMELRATSGWGLRPEAITIISAAY